MATEVVQDAPVDGWAQWRAIENDRLPKCERVFNEGESQGTCGASVRFAACRLCEDCYAEYAEHYHGESQTVNTLINTQ